MKFRNTLLHFILSMVLILKLTTNMSHKQRNVYTENKYNLRVYLLLTSRNIFTYSILHATKTQLRPIST